MSSNPEIPEGGSPARQAVVTGGTKGLGLAVATKLLQLGFDVTLTYSTDFDAAE